MKMKMKMILQCLLRPTHSPDSLKHLLIFSHNGISLTIADVMMIIIMMMMMVVMMMIVMMLMFHVMWMMMMMMMMMDDGR